VTLDKKTLVIIAEALVILALSALLYKGCASGKTGTALTSDDATTPKREVKDSAPLRALDKPAVRDEVVNDVLHDKKKEILATGRVSDDSGSRTIAAVLDTKTGNTALIEKRPFYELMSRQELGVGYGFTDDGEAKQVYYRNTFARVGSIYTAVELEIFSLADKTGWSAMAQVSYRW
jgi:hypothetical protein